MTIHSLPFYSSVADARLVPLVCTAILFQFSMVFENDYLGQDLVIPSDRIASEYLKYQVLLPFLNFLSSDPCVLFLQTVLSALISVERGPAF